MQPSRQSEIQHPLLQRAARARALRRERTLQALKRKRHYHRGVVDLAFLEVTADFDGWTVVDFKTDRELKNAEEQYRELATYLEAIRAATLSAARGFLLVV